MPAAIAQARRVSFNLAVEFIQPGHEEDGHCNASPMRSAVEEPGGSHGMHITRHRPPSPARIPASALYPALADQHRPASPARRSFRVESDPMELDPAPASSIPAPRGPTPPKRRACASSAQEESAPCASAAPEATPVRRTTPLRSRLPAPPASGGGEEPPHAEAVAGGRAAQVYVAAWAPAPGAPPTFAVRVAGTAYVCGRAGTVEERPAAELARGGALEWRPVGSATATPEAVRTLANAFRVAPRMLRGADGTPQSFAVRLLQHIGLGGRLAPLLPLLERFPSSARCPWLAEVRRAEADEEEAGPEPARRTGRLAAHVPPPPVAPAAVRAAQALERRAAAVRALAEEIGGSCGRRPPARLCCRRPRGSLAPLRRDLFCETDSERIYSVTLARDFSAGRARLDEERGRLKRVYDDRARDLPRREEREAIFDAAVPAAAALLPDPVRSAQESAPRSRPFINRLVDAFDFCSGRGDADRRGARARSPASASPREAPAPAAGARPGSRPSSRPPPPAPAPAPGRRPRPPPPAPAPALDRLPRPPPPARARALGRRRAARPASPAAGRESRIHCAYAGPPGAPPARAF
eukprot:tig00000076_g2428.t1